MITYALSIFLSAFLLFQIQPLVSKTLLPWFGGASSLWTAAMLFFQILLTGGYAYANGLVRLRSTKKQTFTHLIVLTLSVCLIAVLWMIWPSPVTPGSNLKPTEVSHPMAYLFFLLTITVGLPFFVLSTNSPLTQDWFSRKFPGRSPYWLYALSNTGSLLGLVAFPFVFEPLFSIRWQGWIWAGGYLLFALLAAFNVLKSLRHSPVSDTPTETHAAVAPHNIKISTQIYWIFFSACASILLLAVTSQITQEVAAIPFLWVIPLALYLLSFVLTFSDKGWYNRKLFGAFLLAATIACFYVLLKPQTHFITQIIIYNFFLFTAVMICNGELYSLRPHAARLTRFYLLGSVGGALGGLFVNLVAPLLFKGYWELYVGLAFVWILLALVWPRTSSTSHFKPGFWVVAVADVVVIVCVYFVITSTSGNLFVKRNFYGVVTVRQNEIGAQQAANVLVHGTTMHGFQFIDPALRETPTSYFNKESGVGLAILNHPRYNSGMRVGVLGLGAGTLAAYGQPNDDYRFYEINPVMIDLANGLNGYFSFITDNPAKNAIILGDARLSLENELKSGMQHNFDLLVLDTFSSDSIPVHLVTREAFEVYLRTLAPDGMIAAHISNSRLDLRPVFWQLAQYYNLEMAVIHTPAENRDSSSAQSVWVLLTRDSQLLELPALQDRTSPLTGFRHDIRLWTDDYSNLIQLLR
ncbi:MAG: ferrichrome ABC transporter permease [Chloroflexi bacterium HGW-Chloroflexi-4]|nr:MAG: ferrichrome ABC transporter permease [Chloroflexi bacterium HGW-Chloroflexi-4]